MTAEQPTGPEAPKLHDILGDPSQESFAESDNPIQLWVQKAMSRNIIPIEDMVSDGTWAAIVDLRVPEAHKMGIEILSQGPDLPPYIRTSSAEQSRELERRTQEGTEALVTADPIAQASTELAGLLLAAAEGKQGTVYDVLTELTRWAAAMERNGNIHSGNDAVSSGFLGQLELFLAAKGINKYF